FFAISVISIHILFFSFFFNATPTTEIYTLSLHDALPISSVEQQKMLGLSCPSLYDLRNIFQVNVEEGRHLWAMVYLLHRYFGREDRKSTRLNSSHDQISYAVFCLKKKTKMYKYTKK